MTGGLHIQGNKPVPILCTFPFLTEKLDTLLSTNTNAQGDKTEPWFTLDLTSDVGIYGY